MDIKNDSLYNGNVFANAFDRLVAFFIDIVLIIILNSLVSMLLLLIVQELCNIDINSNLGSFGIITFVPIINLLIVCIIYFTAFESSKWQATVGKRILKIYVENYKGEQLNILSAFLRTILKLISSIIVISFIVPILTRKKQALYDIFLNNVVLKGRVN